MRAVVQRVLSASVEVDGETVGAIGPGMLVLVGAAVEDTDATVARVAAKVAAMRIFEDESGRMNRSLADARGEVLCISQFTLYGDVRRGNRPSFDRAAPRATAEPLYDRFCLAIEEAGVRCARGVFGAEMRVSLVNDGPVTVVVDSAELEQPRRA
ncbi:MAG TPA: D-aminoacyl-tRNA deacylase [Tepidiformaceae bacterium]|nr:D-aminoacyl-tRNA deacylase [Tepidiformaceae bacterium]